MTLKTNLKHTLSRLGILPTLDLIRRVPELVRQLDGPALFWLDGHYSGGDTAKGELDTPVSAELESIGFIAICEVLSLGITL